MRNQEPIAILLCLLLAGCGHKGGEGGQLYAVQTKIVEDAPAAVSPGLYMAYQRSIDLDVEVGQIADIFHAVEKACREATADQCVILDSTLDSGKWTHARLKVRARPAGIQKLIADVSGRGRVVSQSVTAEDLAAPISDAARRIDMLTDYRARLEGLRGAASSDIDALIKVNKELADVQNQLEALAGEKAQLMQRVETETLTISIRSGEERAFWRPIAQAGSGFGETLGEAVAGAITAIAFLLPWTLLLALLIWIFRKWRARRRRASAGS